jgi:hypothetical protein
LEVNSAKSKANREFLHAGFLPVIYCHNRLKEPAFFLKPGKNKEREKGSSNGFQLWQMLAGFLLDITWLLGWQIFMNML